jgi:hypothetical protein
MEKPRFNVIQLPFSTSAAESLDIILNAKLRLLISNERQK